MRIVLPALMTASVLAIGCVPKARHLEALAAADQELKTVRAELTASGERATQLEAQLNAAQGQNQELETLTRQLSEQNKTLNRELAEVSEALTSVRTVGRKNQLAKAELEAQLAAMQERSAATEQQIADARTRIGALEEEAERLAAEKAALEEKTGEYTSLLSELESEIAAGQVTITELSGKLTVQLSNALLFDSGATALKKEGQAALEKVAGVLNEVSDREIRVEGHTDNVPVRSGAPYPDNWALSALRAREVVVLLVEAGIPQDNIALVGFGDQRPVADNSTPEGRADNRRTEIVLVPRLQQR
ncbi:MAG: OmpA family protein [Myxococcota bacterium]